MTVARPRAVPQTEWEAALPSLVEREAAGFLGGVLVDATVEWVA